VENGFGNGFGHLGMSKIPFIMLQVSHPELRAVPDSLLQASKAVGIIEPKDCATEALKPNLVLDTARQVRGSVVDMTGTPLASTKFQLRSYNDKSGASKSVMTDKDGNFDAGVVEKGEYRLLAPSRAWRQPVALTCSGSSTDCDLRVVLDHNPAGVPYAGCQLNRRLGLLTVTHSPFHLWSGFLLGPRWPFAFGMFAGRFHYGPIGPPGVRRCHAPVPDANWHACQSVGKPRLIANRPPVI
jgi:hypothetical protein